MPILHVHVAIIDAEYQLPLNQAQALLCDLQREAKRHPEFSCHRARHLEADASCLLRSFRFKVTARVGQAG